MNYTVQENGTGSVEVCVQLTGSAEDATVSVVFASEDGSAVSGGQGIPLSRD